MSKSSFVSLGIVETSSPAATSALAQALTGHLDAGDVVLLEGPLGAGKTVIARAICAELGLGPEAGVSSPSYALVHRYEGGRLPVAHLDLYRLGDSDELEGLGIRDLLDGDGVLLIEWPERAPWLVDVASLWLRIADLGPERRGVDVLVPPEHVDARSPLAITIAGLA